MASPSRFPACIHLNRSAELRHSNTTELTLEKHLYVVISERVFKEGSAMILKARIDREDILATLGTQHLIHLFRVTNFYQCENM